MKLRRTASAVAVVALVAGLTFAGISPATAAPGITSASPDFTPSANGPRKFMINIVSSILGKITPNKWQREQLANQYQYNHSWEQWEAEFGIPGDVPEGQLITDGYFTTPQTKADYDLRKSQQGLVGGKGNKPLAPPTTRTTKFVNGVGTGAAVITSAAFGLQVGKGVSEMLGFNVNGGLCMNDGIEFVGWLTGTDCEGFFAHAADYAANQDANADVTWGQMCIQGYCAKVLGSGITGGGATDYSCVQTSGTPVGTIRALYGDFRGVQPGVPGAEEVFLNLNQSAVNCDAFPGSNAAVPPYSNPNGNWSLYRDASRIRLSAYINGSWVNSPNVDVVPGDPDPERVLICTIEGTDGVTYTAESLPYTEESGETATPVCPVLPEGVAPVNLQLEKTGPNGPTTIQDEPVTDEYLDWWNTYPECRTGACKLDLIKKPLTPGVSCFDLEEACADWFAQPDKADLYQCRYGIHDVDLADCNAYEGVFKPERIAIGAPYSDPLTGEWSGGQGAPKPDSDALGQTIQDPTTRRGCNGMNVTGFDPVGFVMRPVQCALEWSFVPRPAVAAGEVFKMTESWDQTPPGEFIGVLDGFAFNIDNSCQGYPVTITGDVHYIGAACDGVMADFAAKVKPVTAVLIVATGLFGISSSVASVIGFRKLGD